MISVKDNDVQEFYKMVVTLTPEEFLGLAKLFNLRLSEVNPETGDFRKKDGEEILNDCAASFRRLKHRERKKLLAAVVEGKKNNGTAT